MHQNQQELAEELANKKIEISQLREVADSISELAHTGAWGDSVEVSYSHTVRRPEGLVTKTHTLTLTDSGEAMEAAAAIEKKLDGWEKLRSQMQGDLESQQRRLNEIVGTLALFAESSRSLVSEILLILHQAG